MRTLEARGLSGSTRATSGDTEGTWQGRDEAARNSDGGRSPATKSGGEDLGSGVRGPISWSARMDFGPDVIPMEPYGRYAGSSSRRRLDTYSRPTSAATLTTSSMNGCRRWWLIGLQIRSSCA